MFAPRNLSELISIPYMDPQPPDMSCTTNSTGLNSLARRSQTSDSASLRKSGFSRVLDGLVDSAAVALASGGAEDEYGLSEPVRRTAAGNLRVDRGSYGAVDVEGWPGRRGRAELDEAWRIARFGSAARRLPRRKLAHLWHNILDDCINLEGWLKTSKVAKSSGGESSQLLDQRSIPATPLSRKLKPADFDVIALANQHAVLYQQVLADPVSTLSRSDYLQTL